MPQNPNNPTSSLLQEYLASQPQSIWTSGSNSPAVTLANSVVSTFAQSSNPSPIPPQPESPYPPTINSSWANLARDYIDEYDDLSTAFSRFRARAEDANHTTPFIMSHWDAAMAIRKTKTEPKSKTPFLQQTFKQAFSKMKFPRVKGEIGIEIEAEGKNLFTTPIQYWGAIQDNSLRTVEGHPPIEYVLREPITREDVTPALKYLRGQLKAAGSELVMSHRCSVHVHINVQDMPMLHLLNYICLYYIFENILIEWSGPDRKGNLFCLRAQDADFQIEMIAAEALRKNNWSPVFDQEYRYAALNTASLGKHGSLEFRSMKGNVNRQMIETWVEILTYLKDISSIFSSPEEISSKFRQYGPRKFFERVFDKFGEKAYALSNFQDFDNMMWDSYRSMRDIAHAIDWENPPRHMLPDKLTGKTGFIMDESGAIQTVEPDF